MKLWIARDEDGSLFMYREKPILYNSRWRNGYAHSKHCFVLPENIFPEVTFENSPQEVKIELVEK